MPLRPRQHPQYTMEFNENVLASEAVRQNENLHMREITSLYRRFWHQDALEQLVLRGGIGICQRKQAVAARFGKE